ncbi:MAG: hypothetical protein QOC55_1311 [Thermoleophilaceae bacterium]|jgi:glucose/arabinose dehydrogenase|nr:hypothetical protein [Thermoleophilaceae bacterium]
MRLTLSLVTCLALAAAGCGGSEDASKGVAVAGLHLRSIGNFASPTYLTAPPRDRHRVFVVEQAGTIRVVRDGRKLARPFLDVRPDVLAGGERGLLSMAFAPDYANSGLFYVYFTGRDGDIHIQEFKRSSAERADPSTRRELVRIEHSQYPNHNGGQLQFGPDGRLYTGTGDGGLGGDPFRNGQNPHTLLGKILRFDPARLTPSVVAIGLRNPWRFSFDRATRDVVIADVGQDKYEEVDFVKHGTLRGRNFGWSRYEGFHAYYGGSKAGLTKPLVERAHSQGNCSITGGYIVRDRALRSLYGRYVYGDYCNAQLRSVVLAPGRARDDHAIGIGVPQLTSFGQDARGRVYALSQAGPVYRLAPR